MKLAVVVLRNLSAGWLGAYGNEWVATPNLDRLAAEGIVFERHIAERTDGQSDSYAELGKRFAGISIRTFDDLVPPWNVPEDVFASYAEEYPEERLVPVNDPVEGPLPSDDLAAGDALRCSYAAVLTRLDAKLGRLFEEFEEARIVVTADRGYALGEHGEVGGSMPHVEGVHLPLVVRLPKGDGGGERVDRFTQPMDLVELIARSIDRSQEEVHLSQERSIDQTISRFNFRSAALTLGATGEVAAIRTDDWTCLFCSSEDANADHTSLSAQLYAFPDDRREQNDLAARLPERVEELAATVGRADDYSK